MMSTIDQAPVTNAVVERELARSTWADKEVTSPLQAAKQMYAEWNRLLAAFEILFKQHVYENLAVSDNDVRQHRASLHRLIGDGEQLALDFIGLNLPEETKAYVFVLDQKVAALTRTLWEWHGPMHDVSGIPEDFMAGMREISEGKTIPLERALTEQCLDSRTG